MRWLALGICWFFLVGSALANPLPSKPGMPDDRQKSGPITIRGIVSELGTHGFKLQTTHHGSFQVLTQRATQLVEKGKSGSIALHNGDHVGVRGFQRGQTLQAIAVRIYPIKPKPYSLKGSVTSISGNTFTLVVPGKKLQIRLTGTTTILLNHQTGARLQPGDRVDVRVLDSGTGPTALHVHIYVRHIAGRHVKVNGVIEVAGAGRITIHVGSTHISIAIGKGTAVHVGKMVVGPSVLRSGQTVTVYACCGGSALTASSVHVHKAPVRPRTTEFHGRVVAISAGTLAISTGHTAIAFVFASTTSFQVGSKKVRADGVHLGDQISVRAIPMGAGWQALKVHVLAVSRRLRTVDGVVTSVSGISLGLVTHAGKRYTVRLGRGTAMVYIGAAAHPATVQKGDRVRAKGYSADGTTVAAIHVEVRRQPPKQVTLRGTVLTTSGGQWVILDAVGGRHVVRLATGVQPRLGGKSAPPSALFVGVQVRVHGQLTSGVLVASAITLTARSRTVSGKVAQVSPGMLAVRTSSGDLIKIDLAVSVIVTDGTRRVQPRSLSVGAFVRVSGYEEPSLAVRAFSIAVQHPAVSLSGILLIAGGKYALQTTAGERYSLRFGPATHINSSRTHQPISPVDLPLSAHVHVDGAVDSMGALVVTVMSVRLAAVTVTGRIATIADKSWVVTAPDGSITVRLGPATPITQGSHALTMADVVVQDDLTVYGDALGGRTVLARKIVVHRRLVGIDGVVGSLGPNNFILHAADGDHTVFTGPATVISGIGLTIQEGLTVHVSGYLRGDGVLLATRVRILKQ